ncbi:hypothetical protein BDBG_09059 [Blastomyces gilchristii SLH14081]|uniref:Uncharacterized protein n=1 Tax=Blastomyces gilchristii (strain SLH14081) TaxID=559298 RepID=A0A179V3N9_BLAGS|nr:uncharacterized protein BDBG_09059 [Blastomyces gilchristii SLH14081]OAT13951.1 hypothetical protein BDBG_09059 [Blastomyces gilchristii SLH14081]
MVAPELPYSGKIFDSIRLSIHAGLHASRAYGGNVSVPARSEFPNTTRSLGMELIITKGGMQKYTLRSVKGYGRSWDYTLRSAVVAQESPSNGMVDDQRDYTLWSVVVAKESPLKDTEPTKLRFGASRATEEKGLYASERSSGE